MNIFSFYNIVYSGPAFSQSVIYSRLFMYVQHHTACFIEKIWSPCRSYLLSAVQVHTTSHCMFHREQLVPMQELSTLGCSRTHNITLHVLQRKFGPHVGVIYSRLFKYTQHHTEVLQTTVGPPVPPKTGAVCIVSRLCINWITNGDFPQYHYTIERLTKVFMNKKDKPI